MFRIAFFILILSFQLKAQSGIFKDKYDNGNLKSEVSVIDNIYEGTSYWYYENGLIKTEKTFSKGRLNGWTRHYYPTGLKKEEFFIKEGVKDGLYKSYFENGALAKVINYENGIRIKIIEFEEDPLYQAPPEAFKAGVRKNRKRKEYYICNIDVCPEPIGGLYSVYKHLQYPTDARLYGLEGKVLLLAHIDTEGNVTSTKVIKGIGLGCDEAAQTAVQQTRFFPGKNNDEIISADVTFSVEFKLDSRFYDAYAKTDSTVKEKQYISVNKKPEPKEEKPVEEVKAKPEKTEPTLPEKLIECEIEVCPEPLNGMAEIQKNLEIPRSAKRQNIKGFVIVSAVVDDYGFVRDTKVIKGLGHGCDEAAEMAVLATQFKPGKQNGKEVQTTIKIVVEIK
ncbi:MAG: TonB family protein [Rhodothermaceae bacterium]